MKLMTCLTEAWRLPGFSENVLCSFGEEKVQPLSIKLSGKALNFISLDKLIYWPPWTKHLAATRPEYPPRKPMAASTPLPLVSRDTLASRLPCIPRIRSCRLG